MQKNRLLACSCLN